MSIIHYLLEHNGKIFQDMCITGKKIPQYKKYISSYIKNKLNTCENTEEEL